MRLRPPSAVLPRLWSAVRLRPLNGVPPRLWSAVLPHLWSGKRLHRLRPFPHNVRQRRPQFLKDTLL